MKLKIDKCVYSGVVTLAMAHYITNLPKNKFLKKCLRKKFIFYLENLARNIFKKCLYVAKCPPFPLPHCQTFISICSRLPIM
jgi:hypothetical protein